MTPDAFEQALRAGIQPRYGREPIDEDLAFTFVARSGKGLGIRPQLLSHAEDGTKVYGITVKQARRLLDRDFGGVE